MTRPTDEILMAFADGALDPEESQRVERYLESDPEAKRLVEQFRRSALLAQDAFAAPMSTQPPVNLVDLILAGRPNLSAAIPAKPGESQSKANGANGDVIDFRRAHRDRAIWVRFAVPLAASLALLVGIGAGLLLSRLGSSSSPDALALGTVAGDTALHRSLEQARSGEQRDGHVVVSTFRDKYGRYCREIELVKQADRQPFIVGVACRDGRSEWIVEGAARLAVIRQQPPGTSYTPSGASERDALEALLNLLGAGKVLSPQEEGAALSRKWGQ